ncbi:MAG: NAD(P)-dependent oxidoreductase [Candidatus Caenarcaniphilales bacterium]|nr:NAD(P)-dependent oxidoreductase [Candidatus Caenarcaniphilales bacterium]
MSNCIIFGGSGFIGTHLAGHLLNSGRFERVYIADMQPSAIEGTTQCKSFLVDIRKPIPLELFEERPDWIFNLAAVHREPGHMPQEYFDTNINGARHITAFAEQIGCENIFFTSSISVYGPTAKATDESSPLCPTTPYGSSKLAAELIHEIWLKQSVGRRLVTVRPGVIYGPGDPGNILRMIRAIQKGYFVFPGSPRVFKSYGYIYGLLKSIDFVLQRAEPHIIYNYVEYPSESLAGITADIKDFLGVKTPILAVPLPLLLPIAHLVQLVLGDKNPIHPTRVAKAATSTHIIPAVLKNMGFEFNYNFASSLKHWQNIAPFDFA